MVGSWVYCRKRTPHIGSTDLHGKGRLAEAKSRVGVRRVHENVHVEGQKKDEEFLIAPS